MLVLFTPLVSCSSASKGFTSLTEEQKEVLAYLPRDIVISHSAVRPIGPRKRRRQPCVGPGIREVTIWSVIYNGQKTDIC